GAAGGTDDEGSAEFGVEFGVAGGAHYRFRLDAGPDFRPEPILPAPDAPAPPARHAPADFAPYASAAQAWRERGDELRLTGMRCAKCEAPEYPPAPACPTHGAGTDLVPHEIARTGRVFTRTRDHVFPIDGPHTMAVVELADGARFYGQVAAGHDVAIGDAVELVLRRVPTGAGAAPRWFWKILPTAAPTGG
ncbi:zinc ribbon domain-containing protein, partial [Streptomyces sp. SID3343]|uniref:Zn-ribbon domain-containing OB-fold protein n=1 Tax=Streptomyces sp. SID3343 TaxID=2690260 RepID=UPI0013C25285